MAVRQHEQITVLSLLAVVRIKGWKEGLGKQWEAGVGARLTSRKQGSLLKFAVDHNWLLQMGIIMRWAALGHTSRVTHHPLDLADGFEEASMHLHRSGGPMFGCEHSPSSLFGVKQHERISRGSARGRRAQRDPVIVVS